MRTKHVIAAAALAATLLLAGCGSSSSGGSSDGGTDKATTTTDGGSKVTVPTDNVEIPADFPKAFLPPDGATVTEATTLGADGTSFLAKVTVDDAKAAYEAYKTQVADAGYEILGAQFTDSEQGGYGGFGAKGDDYTAAITFGPDPTGSFSTLTINIAPAT